MSWIFIIEHTMHKEYVFVLNPKYFQILWQKRFISNVAVYPKLRRPKPPYFFQFYDKSLIHIYFGSITLFVFVYCCLFYYFTLAKANENGWNLIIWLNIWKKSCFFNLAKGLTTNSIVCLLISLIFVYYILVEITICL